MRKATLRNQHDTGRAQVKTWYSLDKINSYTTNTVVIRNENNLTLRINKTLSLYLNVAGVYCYQICPTCTHFKQLQKKIKLISKLLYY